MHFYAMENELSYKAIFVSEIVFEYYMQKCLFENKLTLLLVLQIAENEVNVEIAQ